MELDASDLEDTTNVKIVFLGDRAVGKTSIIRRFISDQFDDRQHSTIGIDYMFKTVAFRGSKYKIELWDTAGQEKYRSLVKTYLKNADCCIYVHDVNDLTTYQHLIEWMNIMEEANNKQILQIIAGNKCDLKQQQFEKEANNFKLLYNKQSRRLISAKQRTNIRQIFYMVLQKLGEIRKNAERQKKVKAAIKMQEIMVKKSCCGWL